MRSLFERSTRRQGGSSSVPLTAGLLVSSNIVVQVEQILYAWYVVNSAELQLYIKQKSPRTTIWHLDMYVFASSEPTFYGGGEFWGI